MSFSNNQLIYQFKISYSVKQCHVKWSSRISDW